MKEMHSAQRVRSLRHATRRTGWLWCAMAGITLGGCKTAPPSRPLSSSAFYDTPRSEHPTETPATTTSPGATSRNSNVNHTPDVTDAPKVPVVVAATKPASQPAPTTRHSDNGYLTLGAVLAEVNGKGIYADEVLADIAGALHDKAVALDAPAYRTAADELIRQALNARISTELAYTAAERFLSKEDKQLADMATERWRQEQITEAGGSLQQARARAAELGVDFETLVAQQARLFTIDVYRQKKILPQVQVTVNDMRQYYRHNLEKLYTKPSAVHFLLIQVDSQRSGGTAEAEKKIGDIRRRAVGGEDFGTLSHDMSDSALLRNQHGDVGWVDKGAFRMEAVEAAAWKLQPGEISEVIKADDTFYLVKGVAVRQKQVLSFDNEQVQTEIRQTLRNRQMTQLLQQAEQKLRADAAVTENPQAMAVTMEMAMQKYAQWHPTPSSPQAQ